MSINLIDSELAISEVEIDELQAKLGGKFPQAFRRLYLARNGGFIGDKEDGNTLLLAGFVAIKFGRLPIDLAYRELISDYPHMHGKVPFAFDEGGNYFVFSLFGHAIGQVGLWVMDTEEYHVVADDFQEFLERLMS